MQVNNVSSQIKDLVEKSQKILVLSRENPTMDGIYSLLALGLWLKTKEKNYYLVAGKLDEAGGVTGSDQISQTLPIRNLIISFDYVQGAIEKVSYNVEGNRFNLVITPRVAGIKPEQVNYSYSGENFDLILVVDVPELSMIDSGAQNLEKNFPEVPVINIDHTQINKLFGQINYVFPQAASTSELLVEILQEQKGLSIELAELLYQGIKAATHNFSLGVKSSTLERAAECLKVIERNTPEPVLPDEPEQSPKEQPASPPNVPDSSWLAPKIFRSSQIDN